MRQLKTDKQLLVYREGEVVIRVQNLKSRPFLLLEALKPALLVPRSGGVS